MNVKTWLKTAKKQINPLDAELILCHVLHFSDRAALATHDKTALTKVQLFKLNRALRQRSKGKPLAYITGHKEFYGRDFKVNRHVLIPRPESEAIIDLARKLNPQKILDLGTGSGCLGLTLSAELGPTTKVACTDISTPALLTAAKNAIRLFKNDESTTRRLDFYLSNLLTKVPRPNSYDLIIANLPYVDSTWDWLDRKSLRYEPYRALFAADHGLALYQELFAQIKKRRVKAPLLIEADPSQHRELKTLAKSAHYKAKKIDGFAILFVFQA